MATTRTLVPRIAWTLALGPLLALGGDARAEVGCSLDLREGVHDCGDVPGVRVLRPPSQGQAVLQVTLDPQGSELEWVVFEVEYAGEPRGWTLNIGDSATNNGAGGDGATQSNDAEVHVRGLDMAVHGNDENPARRGGRLHLEQDLVRAGTRLALEVRDRSLRWHAGAGRHGWIRSPYLFALGGQPDTEGPVNHDVFAAFNRVIQGPWRSGTGVGRVVVRLGTADEPSGMEEGEGPGAPGPVEDVDRRLLEAPEPPSGSAAREGWLRR